MTGSNTISSGLGALLGLASILSRGGPFLSKNPNTLMERLQNEVRSEDALVQLTPSITDLLDDQTRKVRALLGFG